MDVRRNVRRRRQQRLAHLSAAAFGDGDEGRGVPYGPGPLHDDGPPYVPHGDGAPYGGIVPPGDGGVPPDGGGEPGGGASRGNGARGPHHPRNGSEAHGGGGFGRRNETASLFGHEDRDRPPVLPADPELWWKQRMQQQAGAGEPPGGNAFGRLIRGLAVRTLWALALFGVVGGWLRFELPGAGAMRGWLSAALHEELDVEAVRAWYEATFAGSPAFLPLFRDKSPAEAETVWGGSPTVPPVEGRVVETFAQNGRGVRFAAPAASPVRAVYAGLVMQVARSGDGGTTILIRHPNRVLTVYGPVDAPAVRANDWVEAGQTIGRLASAVDGEAEAFLDFAVRQNGRTLDPAAVIPLD